MEKIGFGVIGCGFIGELHCEVISSLKKGYLAAIADSNTDKVKTVANKWECAGYTDYHELLKNNDVKIVSICLPSGMHSKVAIEAARAGKHVICEKPIDIEVERAQKMVDVCRECGVEFGVIMQHRFDEPVIALKKALADGKLGKLLWGSAKTIWYRDDAYFANPWRGTWAFDGGGALINQSIHYIDLLLYVFGDVKSVSGKCRKLLHSQIETEDVGVANIEFENGCLGTIEGTTVAFPGLYAELAVYSEHGTVIIRNDQLLFYGTKEENQDFGKLLNPEKANQLHPDATISADSHRRQYEDFVEAVIEGRKPKVTGEDALESLKVIKAIYESSQKREEVFLNHSR